MHVYVNSLRVTATPNASIIKGLLEHLHVYVNSPRVTTTPFANIIEGFLEHLHVNMNSLRVTVTPYIEELHLLSIKIQGYHGNSSPLMVTPHF